MDNDAGHKEEPVYSEFCKYLESYATYQKDNLCLMDWLCPVCGKPLYARLSDGRERENGDKVAYVLFCDRCKCDRAVRIKRKAGCTPTNDPPTREDYINWLRGGSNRGKESVSE